VTRPQSSNKDRLTATALRVAASGDLHCSEVRREDIEAALAELRGGVDIVLLAGDLTTHGEPAEAEILAAACGDFPAPIFAVLGNHDWHAGHADEIESVLEEGGIKVMQREWTVCQAGGTEVGIVATKGFVGGFTGSHLPDFGEPLLRQVYAETTAEVDAIDEGLRAVAASAVRIVLLHYAPTASTLVGEPEGIWAFLGCDRMATPIAEHQPDLVLHGHAHAGRFEGSIGGVPVFNVSVPVMRREFSVFELGAMHERMSPLR
jgi:Icc-related predicted phosphoesterase